MATPVRTGLLLGVLVTAWTLVMGFSGWFRDPALANLFFLVVPLEIGLVVWLLMQRRHSATYGEQLRNGLVLAATASVVIFVGSIVCTTLVFPNYFQDAQVAREAALRAQGLPEVQLQATLGATAAMQTPLMNALTGVIGTLVTGVASAALGGIFLRRRPAAARL